MERRTVLAFVLMFAVLLGWNALFGPKSEDLAEPPATESPARADADVTAPLGTEPLAERSQARGESNLDRGLRQTAGAPTLQEADSEMGEVVKVVTDHFYAEIDLVGGDILSWALREYDRVDGGAVDLISLRSLERSTQRAHALRLVVDGRSIDLRNVPFQSDTRKLVLDGDRPQGILELKTSGPDGAELTLEYVFENSTYGFGVIVRYRAGTVDAPAVVWEVSWPGGIANTEPDSTSEYNEYRAVAKVGADIHKRKYTDLRKGDKGRPTHTGTVSWVGVTSRYFSTMVIMPEPTTGEAHFDGNYEAGLQTFSTAVALDRGPVATLSYSVFLGPMKPGLLAAYAGEVGKIVDLGPGILRPVSSFMVMSITGLYKVIPNYGWVIVLISVLTKLMFYPLTKSSTRSMRRMQELQPKMQKIKEKYKDDQQKQSQAMMQLYKQEKINPVGGCLPLLVQMPVFITLFHVLRKTIELRQAGWIAWIDDLSRPDVLATLPFSLPLLGNKLCLLPILMAVSMWAQTKLSTPAKQDGGGTMAMQARMMTTFMPIFMFFIFYNSPSGLVLYWLVNTILTAAQTWKIHREMSPAGLHPDPKAA